MHIPCSASCALRPAVSHSPAALASSGSLLELHNLRPHLRPNLIRICVWSWSPGVTRWGLTGTAAQRSLAGSHPLAGEWRRTISKEEHKGEHDEEEKFLARPQAELLQVALPWAFRRRRPFSFYCTKCTSKHLEMSSRLSHGPQKLV